MIKRCASYKMPIISIYHDDHSERSGDLSSMNFDNYVVFEVHWGTIRTPESATAYMNQLMAKYADSNIVILTDIFCDEYHAPCGCTGYDGVCEYHRGYDEESDFAPCLCSVRHNIKCAYHAR